MQDLVRTIISTHTGQDYDKVARDTDRDYYLSAQLAKEYGMVDEILTGQEEQKTKTKSA